MNRSAPYDARYMNGSYLSTRKFPKDVGFEILHWVAHPYQSANPHHRENR